MPLPLALNPPIANTARLRDAILSLQPTAYWPLDDGSGTLRSLAQNWPATVTGSPTYGVAAPSPIGRGVTFSGTGQYATTATDVPTPTVSMSVLVFLNTTDATAAARYPASRGANPQASWHLLMPSNHSVTFTVLQAANTTHATVNVAGAVNDGLWHLVLGTFDGTTVRLHRDAVAVASSASLTGTWHTASTQAIGIAQKVTGSLFPGTMAHVAYWADRVVTDAERLWLNAVARGG